MELIYNREKKEYYREEEDKDKVVKFLYKNCVGRLLLIVFANPLFSKIMAKYYNSKLSKKKIDKYIKKHNIDISDCINKKFETFNDFFKRRTVTKIDNTKEHLISPAYGKVKAYKIDHNLIVNIKDSLYHITDIVKDKDIAKRYRNGTMLVIRMSLTDYHNFVFVDDGIILKQYKIKGQLHSVRSISEKYKVYSHNKRTVTIMKTDNFGEITQVEIGALLVGNIINNDKLVFKKGEDKGHFEYGGSTIVLFVNKNVKIDKDIIVQSLMHNECKVNLGDRVGVIENVKEA